MPTGALMAARQALGQYFIYAKPWQRVLIAGGVIAAGTVLAAAGIVTGHVVMAVAGSLILLGTGNACVQVLRARRARRKGGAEDGL